MEPSARVAAVTGGASGIGRSICLQLARDGADIVVLDIDHGGAQQVAAEVIACGRRASAIALDVTDEGQVHAAFARAHTDLGPVRILVNDAGIGEFVPFAQLTPAQWHRMLGVHLHGTFYCTHAVLPDMLAGNWGRVVNIASVAGLNGGGPGLAHYAAAKAGIVGLTKALALELGPVGITVNAVAPGLVDTPMLRRSAVPDAIIQRAVTQLPLRRLGRPEDIAAACAYLVSDAASWVTGQVISPNGGAYL